MARRRRKVDMDARYFLRVRNLGANKAWGDWLQKQMRTCGFGTDDELADAIGVANSTVFRWRAKGARPDIAQLRQLVGALRTDLRTLLVVSGTLTERELGGAVGRADPLEPRELLERDRSLSQQARVIMLAAYDAAVGSAPAQPRARSVTEMPSRAAARRGKPEKQ
jgi:transcriptional regulator with XRE-family HTH domain